MPTATKTRAATPSTPRLSEVARHLVVPEGIVTSVFSRVERRLSSVGYGFDRWQQGLGSVALGCRDDGLYAATIGGVVVSIPRQVGKTYTVGGLVVGLCLEFPGMRVAWTSHHNRTNTNTFRSLQSIVKRAKMRGHVAAIREANGEQEIRFTNGSVIFFGARAQGFGRGMEEMDVLVLDEAQILDLKALEDMVPATNQAKHPHGALIFFIGTPPRPTDPGEAFKAKRAAALAGETADQVYVEFSADPDAQLDDMTQWPKMNPSYPHRTPLASMLRMRENIPDDDSWRREAMGIWDADTDGDPWGVIDRRTWGLRIVDDDGSAGWLDGAVTLAVEADQSLTRTCIAVAGERSGKVGAQIVLTHPGTAGVVEAIVAKCAEGGVAHVVIDSRSPAAVFTPDLEEAGITVTAPKTGEVTTATSTLRTLFQDDGIVVRDSPELGRAAAVAKLRKAGESQAIDRWGDPAAVPLIALNLAVWGHQNQPDTETFEPDFLVL